jgi:hypothetical protein
MYNVQYILLLLKCNNLLLQYILKHFLFVEC